MKPRDYCCCAIPTVYTGIYLTLLEQLTLGVVAGTLSIATPDIVGNATFSAAKWIFAIICYVGAGIQLLGFASVFQERPIFFRRYTTLHLLVTVAAFSVAAVWIALSAARHSEAKSKCITRFFTNTDEPSEADTLCNIFPWVDIGLMGGLWVLLFIAQFYFYIVVSSYGSGQRLDHEKYDSMYDPTNPLTSDIPLNERGDPWDSHDDSAVNPLDSSAARYSDNAGGYHSRQESAASVDTVMGDKVQQNARYSAYGGSYAPPQPADAYTQDPSPTPHAQATQDPYYYNAGYGYGSDLEQPGRAQPHPAEGSFRRKTPRLQKPLSEDFRV